MRGYLGGIHCATPAYPGDGRVTDTSTPAQTDTTQWAQSSVVGRARGRPRARLERAKSSYGNSECCWGVECPTKGGLPSYHGTVSCSGCASCPSDRLARWHRDPTLGAWCVLSRDNVLVTDNTYPWLRFQSSMAWSSGPHPHPTDSCRGGSCVEDIQRGRLTQLPTLDTSQLVESW